MSTSLSRITTLYIIINLLLQSKKCRDLRYCPKNATLRVHGGIPAQLGELPYQVGFKTRHDKNPEIYYTFCGGAIIGKTKILSAAHCFVGEDIKYFPYPRHYTFVKSLEDKYAVAASIRNVVYFKQDEYEQWRSLRNVTYPEDYEFPNSDLAVLFVRKPFKFNDFVKPITIANRYVDYEGVSMVSGYGEISHMIGSDSLLKAQLLLFPLEFCVKLNPTRNMADKICTSLIGADIGRGDSGGPLVFTHASDLEPDQHRTLIGIASGTIEQRNSIFQILPLLGNVLPTKTLNHKSFKYDPKVISEYAKYQQWNPRVVNGWPAKLGDAPYQIGLKYLVSRTRQLYMTFCGASIIGPRKVLSAAHCFEERTGSNCHKIFYPGKASSAGLKGKYAVAGTLKNIAKYKSDGQWRLLEKVQFPKSYDFPTDDIAVVIPKRRFNYNEYVGPIPMASLNIEYQGSCLASGYGRTGPTEDHHSPELLLAHLTLMPTNWCSKAMNESMNYFVCTSVVTADVGQGDSGGPLVCAGTGDPRENSSKGVLVGVTCGTMVDELSLFTRVSSFQEFIKSVNSVTLPIYKYNVLSCTAITIVLIYKMFVLL